MQYRTADGTRKERTGWRDQKISQRHRDWGFNCPAVDLDFLMVEYNLGKPVGLVEYKHYLARPPNMKHATYRALGELADCAGLPFLIAFYWPETWAFRVFPANEFARKHFTNPELMTERQFVQRLYRLRQLTLARELGDKLNDVLPTDISG